MKPSPSFAPRDAIVSFEEPDAPVGAGTLDELDRSTDVASLHFAFHDTDERDAQS